MIKEKINGILNKIKNNKKKVIGVTAIVFAAFIFTFAVYNLNNPTYFNRLFANVLNNGKPANDAFEDNTFYSCVVDAYNGDHKDNKKAYNYDLTNEELASITFLTCHYSDDGKITSAKGVEKLTGLTALDLDNNLFTNIDLTNNTLLEKLSISNDKVDNQLANIDISNNTLLKEVNLSWNNLSVIDVSNNTSLTTLNLYSNQLTNIDVSKNTSLTTLVLRSNQLASIDVSKNTSLTNLDLSNNQLTSIDLSNDSALTDLNLNNNQLTYIDLNNNTSLTDLSLEKNQLTSIDVSKNTALTDLSLEENQLTSIDVSKNTSLEYLYLSNNQLTSIDVSKNTSLIDLDLSYNQLTSLDLSNNSSLRYLEIDDTPLKEDILMQAGETYQIEEKIIPTEGQNITYSIGDTSVATIEGNTITARNEGSTTLTTTFGNISFDRKLVVCNVKISLERSENEDYYVINDEENYIYFINGLYSDSKIKKELKSNFGKIVRDGDTLKIVSGEKIYREYKIVCFDGGKIDDGRGYRSVVAYTDNSINYNITAINCTYEILNDGREISIKYNGKEIDRKKIVYVYLPKECKIRKDNGDLLYFGNEIFDDSNINNFINNIDNVSEIDKNKINVLNGTITFEHDDGNYFNIMHGEEQAAFLYPNYVNSNNYDLKNEYIYLGANDFNNDIQIYNDAHEKDDDYISVDNNVMYIMRDDGDEQEMVYSWDLIKVTSDKYDMSGDTMNLGNEDIDLTKINVTNATLKVDNNKLLVMYGEEVVKEFKLEGGKKTTTTTKKDDEKITTTPKDKTTTKKEVKTTKKKVSIIDKIFGNKETTTVKKEETTTKKNIFRKSTTTKLENSSGNVTSNNKNSFKKLVTGSNLLILLLSITGIALIIYIIIDKKKNKEA